MDFITKKYTEDQMVTILNVIIKALQDPKKNPVLPSDLKPEQIDALIAKASQAIENNGLTVSNKNIKDLYVKLATAIVVAYVAEHDPLGAQKTIDLTLADNLTPKEQKQLTTALAFVSVMQNRPDLKLRPSLAFEDNLSPADKKEFDDSLAIALDFIIRRELDPDLKMDPKAIDGLKDKVTDALKDPKSKGKTPEEVARNIAKDMDDPLLGNSLGPVLVIMDNSLGRADTIPVLSGAATTPLHILANVVFNPNQALTGGNSIAAERDAELGESLAEAFNEPLVEAGININPHPQLTPGH
jgi:hypothetical protein